LNNVAKVHEINSKNTKLYLVLISSKLQSTIYLNMWYHHDNGFKLYS